MRKNLKTLLSAAVASAMMLTSVSFTSYAAAEVATIDALQAAIASGETDITVTAPLTITGNVTLEATTPVTITTTKTDVFTVGSGASLTLGDGITVESNTSVLYANGGTITVDGATINSTCTYWDLCYADSNGKINIVDGTLTNGTNIIGAIDNSVVTVSGGTLTSTGKNGVIYAENNAAVTVEKEAALNCASGIGIFVNSDAGAPTVTVTGGTITANTALQVYAGDTTVSGGTLNGTTTAVKGYTENIAISGGSFSSDVSEYLEEDVEQDDEGNVVENVIDTEAELIEAINNATDGDTIVIGGNITLNNKITISNTVTLKSEDAVTITANGVVDALTVTSGGNLTLGKNITIKSDTSVLWANGGTITVDGATINSTCTYYDLCYAQSNGKINIVNGTLTNGTNIIGAIENSVVTVSGGTLTSTGKNGVIYAKNNASVTVENNAVLNCENGIGIFVNSDAGAPTVTVTGGTITADIALQIYAGETTVSGGTLNGTTTVVKGYTENVSITGGSFSSEVPEEYCADGFEPVQNADGTYGVCDHANADTTTFENDGDNHWNVCSACGSEINKAAHNGVTMATCTDKATCATCGEFGDVDSTNHANKATELSKDETGHWYDCECGEKLDFAAHTSSGAATEDTAETCTVCDYVIAPATGHVTHTADASKWLSDASNHWHKCTGCEEKLDSAAHTFDEGVNVKEPTTTETGEKVFTCSVCGYEKTETIPATGGGSSPSIPPVTGTRPSAPVVTTTTTTTTTTTPAEEDEEIEDDIEIEEDDDVEIEEDTDTTQPAEDDYEDDDTDEEVDADVETPADGSSDGNPITGVAISFAGVIASAAAVMLAKKRK